jgi:hypothetical protein
MSLQSIVVRECEHVKNEKGNALLYVIIISFVVSVIAVSIITAVIHFTQSVDKVSQIDLLRQQNSAALRVAIEEIKKIEKVSELPPSMTFMDKTVLINVEAAQSDVWNQIELTVVGESNGSTLSIKQHIKKAPPIPFLYSLFAKESFDINGLYQANISGSPYAFYGGKEIKVSTILSQPTVDGLISYSDPNTPISIKGYKTEDLKLLAIEKKPLPQINYTLAKSEAQKSNCYFQGLNLKIENPGVNLNCGPVKYFDGDVTLTGNMQVDGLLIVNGTLRIIGNTNLTSGQNGLIVVSKNTKIELGVGNIGVGNIGVETINVAMNGVLYTTGNLKGLVSNLDIKGSIVSNNIDVQDIKSQYSHEEVAKIPISLWRYFSDLEVDTFGWTESVQSR